MNIAMSRHGISVVFLAFFAGSISPFASGTSPPTVRRICGDALTRSAKISISPALALAFCENGVVRVVRIPESSSAGGSDTRDAADAMADVDGSLMVDPAYPGERVAPHVTVDRSNPDKVVASTPVLTVTVDRILDRVSFADTVTGTEIFWEFEHRFVPTVDLANAHPGEDATFVVEQSWDHNRSGLYGGGQFQSGLLDFSSATVHLAQTNLEASVPFFVSTEGYGLLWDSAARTTLNPSSGEPLLVVQEGMTNRIVSTKWTPLENGDAHFFADMCRGFGCGDGVPSMKIQLVDEDTKEVIIVQSWDQMHNLPGSMSGVAHSLSTGKTYNVQFTSPVVDARLYAWERRGNRTALRSEVSDKVDYYFLWGGQSASIDNAIDLYRHVTGPAPLYPSWAYGFWQCKERYHTQQELLEAASTFRRKKIPIDAIVQDWHYWGSLGWGPQWDPSIYPDPKGMVANLTDQNIHLMVSVWSKFDKETSFYRNMSAKAFMIEGSTYFDAWNPAARRQFYKFSKEAHFNIGVDALWLDATEPEGYPHENRSVHLGSANNFFNSYSLMTSAAVANGLRADFPQAQGRRVFSLTRSSFAGQQRTGACLWSGDTEATWDSLRRQVAASLNYALSGMPYWSEDIGGFFRPKDQYASADYHLLLTRWFQFGVFTPIFRVHGAGSETELWNYGQRVQDNIVQSAINLRYRLFPYTYSGFWKVANEGWTMQRALSFDFPRDEVVWQVADQFMYGNSFLVAPMLSAADVREVYLPKTQGGWIGFYSGERRPESSLPTTINVSVSVVQIPILVRAGSIVMLGPNQQFIGVSKQDPLEVRIYTGADAFFTLYEDDGKSAVPTASSSTINFDWNDEKQELSIGSQCGGSTDMLASRILNIFVVRPNHGVGVEPGLDPDRVIQYDGKAIQVGLRVLYKQLS